MMITIQNLLRFRILFPVVKKGSIFLIFLLCQSCIVVLAGSPDSADSFSDHDSLSSVKPSFQGKITLKGGALLVEDNDRTSVLHPKKINEKKQTVKRKDESHQPQVPEKGQSGKAKRSDIKLSPSSSSGVSFSKRYQTESLILQNNSGKVIFLKTEDTTSLIYNFSMARNRVSGSNNDPELSCSVNTHCVRPPPFL